MEKIDGPFEDDFPAWVQGDSRLDLATTSDRAVSAYLALGCLAGQHVLVPPVATTHIDLACPFPTAPGWKES